MSMYIPIRVDNPARDDRIIRQAFMKELCRRDENADRNTNPNPGVVPNVFPVRDIWEEVLPAFNFNRVIDSLQRYEMNRFIRLIDPSPRESIQLTRIGKIYRSYFRKSI